MARLSFKRQSSIWLLAALALISACATAPPPPPPVAPPVLQSALSDARVWIDYMPGMKPRGYAVALLTVSNIADAPVGIVSVDGEIRERVQGSVIRRFSCSLESEGTPVTTRILDPGSGATYTVKSGAGYEPFDMDLFPQVTVAFRVVLDNGEVLTVLQDPIDVEKTQ